MAITDLRPCLTDQCLHSIHYFTINRLLTPSCSSQFYTSLTKHLPCCYRPSQPVPSLHPSLHSRHNPVPHFFLLSSVPLLEPRVSSRPYSASLTAFHASLLPIFSPLAVPIICTPPPLPFYLPQPSLKSTSVITLLIKKRHLMKTRRFTGRELFLWTAG